MKLHHQKHHQTYVNGLNTAEESLAKFQTANDVKSIIGLQPALKFNGGGHINHSLFWKNLAPHKSDETKFPTGGKLEEFINRDFGSLDGLKKEMNTKTAAIQGSGWGWLVSPPAQSSSYDGRISSARRVLNRV
jgi:Fe-Mn family superoxide dismutase